MLCRTLLRSVTARTQLYQRLLPTIGELKIHTTSQLPTKLFLDKENQFAHEVLEQSLKPYKLYRAVIEPNTETAAGQLPESILNPNVEDAPLTGAEILHNFRILVRYCKQTNANFADERFYQITRLICAASSKLNNEELIEMLQLMAELPPVESTKSPNYVDLWNALDIECCRRVEHWKSDELLLVCDIWYALNLARICEFVTEALQKLSRKVRKMRPEQLVHAMFFCNLLRRPIHEMFDFEANLTLCASSLSLQELGVMSMGFFKTQTPIRNPELIQHLYERLMTEVDTVEDITLVAILKILRYSTKLPQVQLMTQLLDLLSKHVSRFSLLSCLHVALLGSDLLCSHDEIVELVLQRFNRELTLTRLKDLERICLAMCVFNYSSPTGIEKELCANILEMLQTKVDEIIRFPRCFPACLHFLTLKGFYDPEMISSVLDKNYIRHAYGTNIKMGREIFQLDSFVKINLKDTNYEGHQLPDNYRRTMGKLLTHYIPERNPKYKLNTTDRILVEVKESIERTFKPNVYFKHILPHFERPDVVICYDNKQHRTVPLSPQCPEDYSGVILTREELLGEREASPDITTVVIVVVGWNNVVREKNRYTSLFEMKLKQLELLGHKYVVIFWHEWRDQETQTDRINFLKRRLNNVIKV